MNVQIWLIKSSTKITDTYEFKIRTESGTKIVQSKKSTLEEARVVDIPKEQINR